MTQIFVLPLTQAAKLTDRVAHRFPKRQARAARMHSNDDKLRCLGAGALLAHVLHVSEDQIETDAYGKPFISVVKKQFNLSHSGDYIVLAVGDAAVGVDVQQLGRAREKVALRCFTAEEQLWSAQNDERFFTLWTLKESAVKAVGSGLRLPLNSFSVLPFLRCESIELAGLSLYGQALKLPDHGLAVSAVEPLKQQIEPIFVSAEEITESLP